MSRLPATILDPFLKGEHVMHHQQGIWNGIWSDMMIETSYMKFGVIGVTTKPRTVQIWAKSQHSCSRILKELSELRNKEDPKIIFNKEEGNAKIMNNEVDRRKLRDFLSSCMHPLDTISHNPAEKKINVNKSVEIGRKQLKQFQQNFPEGFRSTISKSVITMKEGKKSNKKKDVEVYNTEIIFSRVMYLLSAGQIDIGDLFSYELSPVPTSLFHDTGEGRYPTSKSVLKNEMKVEVSTRNIYPNAIVIDGCAMLHAAVHWPKGGKVKDLIKAISGYVSSSKEYYKTSEVTHIVMSRLDSNSPYRFIY